ncbi:MAG: hypothetical protein INF75_13580 [Roseomonas sp.]|nr:hypothetical protein [Roseomonas sp.]MCA3328279.1 hypothetical protein [Roseomonas sp.]MCA3329848.1 hypothetical protein [Roseomonas sp.]MCA3333511.1 hypothetical protein [Roseomonas sp.]MCA3346007.1 hypothetical protein [Roseomonas sp.]
MAVFTRRSGFLALPFLAACANEKPGPYVPPGPPSYGHLTPLRLKVGRLALQEPASGTAMLVEQPAPLQPADVMLRMAQDRLSAAGGPGSARFLIQTARLTRERAAAGGMFSPASETFRCVMRCQLEIVSDDNITLAAAAAEARRELTGPIHDDAERAEMAERVVKLAGQDLNVEFEFQLRSHLRSWLQLVAGPGETLPQPVEREALPRS